MCGIGTENSTDGRTLSMTYTIGGSDLSVQAEKPAWNIPDNTMLQANMLIDGGQPWQAQAVGHGTTVEWVIGAASIRSFDTEFRNGHTMTVSFPSGNEAPWTLSLAGSTAASGTLWRCVQDLSDRAHVEQPGPERRVLDAAVRPGADPTLRPGAGATRCPRQRDTRADARPRRRRAGANFPGSRFRCTDADLAGARQRDAGARDEAVASRRSAATG